MKHVFSSLRLFAPVEPLARWLRYGLIALLVALLCGVGPMWESSQRLRAAASPLAPMLMPEAAASPLAPMLMPEAGATRLTPLEGSPSLVAFWPDRPMETAQVSLEQQARQLYEAGRYAEAVMRLETILQGGTGDPVGKAVVLSNLSLIYQQLGDWEKAQSSIEEALMELESEGAEAVGDRLVVWAQALDVKGSLELAMGDAEAAVEAWQQAADLFKQAGQENRALLSQINQAQALQDLGLFRRAILTLNQVNGSLVEASDSLEKAAALRSLGEAQRVAGDLNEAATVLQESLEIAQRLENAEAIAQSYISLGNMARARVDLLSLVSTNATQQATSQTALNEAIAAYRQASQQGTTAMTRLQAQLNGLSLLIDVQDWDAAALLVPQIQADLADLPPGRPAIYAQVNFVQSLMRLRQAQPNGALSWTDMANILKAAYQQAVELEDSRAQSFALGHLGELYEQNSQWTDAEDVTRQALSLSQSINAQDIAYRWQWQLGRVLKADGEREKAISAYDGAFATLQQLRSDLVAANADVKFSFRKSVEPVYREYVDLLLSPQDGQPTGQANLRKAREVMEALQVAQLENFFQSACLEPTLNIDEVIAQQEQRAAVIYPIILSDRLEVILKLPDEDNLVHYEPIPLTQTEVESTLKEFRRNLQGLYTYKQVEQSGAIVYSWLIEQGQALLAEKEIQTLIFVLDSALRNIPMAALYDGEHYLAETYALDLVLGLEVTNPEPLNRNNLRILAAGLVEPPEEFRTRYATLKFVKEELDIIESLDVETTLLREKDFNRETFNKAFNRAEFQVVHLATHGQFGADRQSTFILDSRGKIELNDLSELFGSDRQVSDAPIELLIMSACRTATGDDREVLGIAGTTVRAGARSAIASLWSLDDEASVVFTREFYKDLGKEGVTRAEAVRRAQVAMMQDPVFNHPRYWSPYVLVGSWL